MYAEFYGLKELPFALTPDPRFIYFTPSHTEVMANLHYGIESGKGLVVVTGDAAKPTSAIVDTTTGEVTDGPAGARQIAASVNATSGAARRTQTSASSRP